MSRQNPNPTLRDVLDSTIEDALSKMNCVTLGTIQSFDGPSQTAVVSINYQRVIKEAVSTNDLKANTDIIKPYPLLVQCPVVIMNGGGAALTFPVAKGDTCLLLFCDREIDTWFTSGNTDKPPAYTRMHSLSDAVALVGIRSTANKIASYDTSKVKLMFGSGYITIDSSGNIVVSSPASVQVNSSGTVQVAATGTVTISGSSVSINP